MSEVYAFLTGICVALILLMIILALSDVPENAASYREAITQCEQSLPRDHHCVITAIVEESNGHNNP